MEWLRKKCCGDEEASLDELNKLKTVMENFILSYKLDFEYLAGEQDRLILNPDSSRKKELKKHIGKTNKNLKQKNEELEKIQKKILVMESKNRANETAGAEEPGPSTSTPIVAEDALSIGPMALDDTPVAALSSISGDEHQQLMHTEENDEDTLYDVSSMETYFGSEADYFEEYDDFNYGNCTLLGSDLVKSPQKRREDKTKQQHHKDIYGNHIYEEHELMKREERDKAQQECAYMDAIEDYYILDILFTTIENYDEDKSFQSSNSDDEYFSATEY